MGRRRLSGIVLGLGLFAVSATLASGANAADAPATLASSGSVAPGELTGRASWYGEDFDGRITANGELFDMYNLTAAQPDLPLGSTVDVVNLRNGRHTLVRINDRRTPAAGVVIVLSKAAAASLGILQDETAQVVVRPAPQVLQQAKAAKAPPAKWLQASSR